MSIHLLMQVVDTSPLKVNGKMHLAPSSVKHPEIESIVNIFVDRFVDQNQLPAQLALANIKQCSLGTVVGFWPLLKAKGSFRSDSKISRGIIKGICS